MTPTDPMDRDEALAELLRLAGEGRARLEDPEVRRRIEQLYGRPDALDLLREVAREERLVRLLRLRTGIGSGGASVSHRDAETRARPVVSIGARSQASARADRWKIAGFAAAAALLLGFALNSSAASALFRNFRNGGSVEPRTVATRAAQLDTVNLPDGSRAVLAPNSTIRYSIAALAGPRDVQLEGEALFDVKHDIERPFRVRTRRIVIEDLGTTFVVREYASDARARVAVRSGAASLRTSDDEKSMPIDMRPGDGAYIDSVGTIARFTGDPESFGSWTEGYIEFEAAPLSEVLAELETWYDVEFRMSDASLASQRFTGGLQSTSLSKALETLGPIVHARFAQEGREVTVTARPAGR